MGVRERYVYGGSVPLLQVHFMNSDFLGVRVSFFLALGLYEGGSYGYMAGVRFWRNGL